MVLASENDEELRAMAKDGLDEATARLPEMEEEIKLLLVPADPRTERMQSWRFAVVPVAMRLRFCR